MVLGTVAGHAYLGLAPVRESLRGSQEAGVAASVDDDRLAPLVVAGTRAWGWYSIMLLMASAFQIATICEFRRRMRASAQPARSTGRGQSESGRDDGQ